MLRITLFKSCILNNSYAYTFSKGKVSQNDKSILDNYLDTLQKYTFDLDSSYYENDGTFITEYNNEFNPYEYNYMHVKDLSTNLERYCFIADIYLKNGCAYIDYEEDIWHSYEDKIKGCTPSFLCRSRAKIYDDTDIGEISLVSLPVTYESNNTIDYESILTDSDRKVFIWAEIQLYDLVSGTDEKNIRQTFYFLIYNDTSNDKSTPMDLAKEYIDRLILEMPTGIINNHNFQLGKILFLPFTMFDDISYFLSNESYQFTLPPLSPSSAVVLDLVKIEGVSQALDEGLIFKTINIENDYKNIAIGTFDSLVYINNNGTDFDVELIAYRTNSDFIIKMSVLNQIIDITDDFKYEPPLQSILAEDFSQRKISTELEKYKVSMQKSKTGTSIFGDVADMWTNFGNILLGANIGHYSGLMGQGRGMLASYSNILDKAIYDIPTLKKQEESIKAPKYSNSKGVIINNTALPNYSGGIYLFKLNPDNDKFVKDCVDNFGYKVYVFVNLFNELYINYPGGMLPQQILYNVIRFEKINVYGEFSDTIAKKLNNILENGIKIWYTPTMTEDHYTDDLLNPEE